MFVTEGTRSDRENRILAGYLAAIAGFVNSSGFILIGSFTSHVTGNVGRFADDLALGRPGAAVLAVFMVTAFFAGAFVASMAIEARPPEQRKGVYATLLALEAALLASFTVASMYVDAAHPRLQDLAAVALCLGMGVQNCLVTRLSGAVVRTTHLTGVVTDLGIEAARWFRFWRAQIAQKSGLRLIMWGRTAERPNVPKALLLLTIVLAFIVGSAAGAIATASFEHRAMIIPASAVLAAAIFSWKTTRAILDRLRGSA
jgi:uncharacterized membrane protein YoaK (UPF0700 family)